MNSHNCEYCGQMIKVYARKLRKVNIQVLAGFKIGYSRKMYEVTKELGVSSTDSAQLLRNFSLIERGSRKYTWRIAGRGMMFLMGLESIPKYYFIFNNILQPTPEDYIDRQKQIYISDVYPEVMNRDIALNE